MDQDTIQSEIGGCPKSDHAKIHVLSVLLVDHGGGVSIYIYICMCVYLCVYMYICIYIYIYMCVCIYVCMYIHIHSHINMWYPPSTPQKKKKKTERTLHLIQRIHPEIHLYTY